MFAQNVGKYPLTVRRLDANMRSHGKQATKDELALEEVQKARDYILANGFPTPVELEQHAITARWPHLVERYVVNEIELVCQFRTRRSGGKSAEFVVVIEALPENDPTGGFDLGFEHVAHEVASGMCSEGRQVEYPVLVVVGKPMQDPQRIAPWALRSVARLQSCDPTLNGWTQAADWRSIVADDQALEVARVLENGEGGVARRLVIRPMELGELPCQVVERAPHVLHYVSDQQAQADGGRAFPDPSGEDALAGLMVYLRDDAVRAFVQNPPDSLFELVEVGIRPVELCEDAL